MPGYEVGWHHAKTAEKLDGVLQGRVKRLMIFEPPRHGKSELVSRRLPALALGQNPDLSIIACSYAADLASRMNRDVQRIIDSPPYRALFPEVSLWAKNIRAVAHGAYMRNSDMFEVVGRKGSYRSAGRGQGITGMGGRLIIVDDPFKDREEADSPTIREKVWEWYSSTLRTRLEQNGAIVVMHTRWHTDDLAGKLLLRMAEDKTADQWEVLTLPAICETPGNPDDPRALGEALWPERFPLDELASLRANSEYEWQALYQQNPQGEGGTEWPAEYFGPHIWFDDWPPDCGYRVLALDPSKGKSDKSGDYSAFVMLGLDSDGVLWVDADLDNSRTVEPLASDPGRKSIVTDGLRIFQEFRPHAWIFESNGFQEYVGHAILRAAMSKGVSVPLYAYNNTDNKQARIRTMGAYFAQRRIRVRNTKGGRVLVQQLREFPTATHDDGPDSLKLGELMMDFLLGNDIGGRQPELLRV